MISIEFLVLRLHQGERTQTGKVQITWVKGEHRRQKIKVATSNWVPRGSVFWHHETNCVTESESPLTLFQTQGAQASLMQFK
jgi:hypothetical protein